MKVGVVGGGQLARMMALAGHPLGITFAFLDPATDACAGALGDLTVAAFDDVAAVSTLAGQCDVVTFDFENVPAAVLEKLSGEHSVQPPTKALAVSQDRLLEKALFNDLGIPTAPHAAIDGLDDIARAVEACGFPAILKTRRLGYDGKGQRRVETLAELEDAVRDQLGTTLILEGVVPFAREVSQISVRSTTGETVHYPLTENRHRDGILANSFAPAEAAHLVDPAIAAAENVMERLGYAGVLTIEFFEVDGQLVANELAPRVHNSGHWTIDGAVTSQFENHLRAILGWPLGSPDAIGYSAMINWVGAMPDPSQARDVPHAHWHVYDKQPRRGRKVGHTTLRADSLLQLQARLAQFSLSLSQQLASGANAFVLPE